MCQHSALGKLTTACLERCIKLISSVQRSRNLELEETA